jgi:Domain of unknown function (DUF4349)
MKTPKLFLLILLLLAFAACDSIRHNRPDSQAESVQTKSEPADLLTAKSSAPEEKSRSAHNYSLKAGDQNPILQQVSLQQANQSQSVAEAMDRKIIRNADLTLEVGAPAEAQRKISSITETLGGFVVTSESKQRQVGEAKQELEISLVVRVPAIQFGAALDQIRSAGSRVLEEKISGQDVTEEFIDIEARVKTQKALEAQFLEIMKQAHKVEDALEVQRQIADVRTEIEKLEGRKRFLENRATLSTISINLQPPTAIAVNASGFGRSIREAVVDGVDVASAIVLFLIRFVIVMIPISLLVILPGWLLARAGLRRTRKMQLSRATANGSPDETAE